MHIYISIYKRWLEIYENICKIYIKQKYTVTTSTKIIVFSLYISVLEINIYNYIYKFLVYMKKIVMKILHVYIKDIKYISSYCIYI